MIKRLGTSHGYKPLKYIQLCRRVTQTARGEDRTTRVERPFPFGLRHSGTPHGLRGACRQSLGQGIASTNELKNE
jgi:hypothetical protein